MSDNKIIKCLEVNPSTPQPEGWGLLRVDPERRIFTPPSKTELGAVERVKCKSGIDPADIVRAIPNGDSTYYSAIAG